MNHSVLAQTSWKTPIGFMTIKASEVGITEIILHQRAKRFAESKAMKSQNAMAQAHLALAKAQLTEYFDGQRKSFDIPLDIKGTPFQKKVWKSLARIPYGKTKSYKELAQLIDNPRAVRAVGGANGKNPICIIIPCHRIIAHDGGIGGYSAGLRNKQWLLEHECKISTLSTCSGQ